MINKPKKNPQISNEQFAECYTRLITLRKKYKIMLEREVSRAKHLRENNIKNKANEQRIKILYYLIGMVDNSVDRLYEIRNINELNSTFNELDSVVKQLNQLSANEKSTRKTSASFAGAKECSEMNRCDNANLQNNATACNRDVPECKNNQTVASYGEETQVDVNKELDEINMYLEGYFN